MTIFGQYGLCGREAAFAALKRPGSWQLLNNLAPLRPSRFSPRGCKHFKLNGKPRSWRLVAQVFLWQQILKIKVIGQHEHYGQEPARNPAKLSRDRKRTSCRNCRSRQQTGLGEGVARPGGHRPSGREACSCYNAQRAEG